MKKMSPHSETIRCTMIFWTAKRPRVIPGGRGSVRAGNGHRGSAGASPSRKSGPADLERARLRPSRQWPPRLSRSFALPKSCSIAGGRGSVRAGKGRRGSAGASPSQNRGQQRGRARLRPSRQRPSRLSRSFALPKHRASGLGRARLRPSRQRPSRLSRSFALPKCGATRTREGEAPSEPAKAIAAQQELRPPKIGGPADSGGRGSVRAGNGHRGSAGASPSQDRASGPGRARLRPSRQRPSRLSRSFALPKSGPADPGGRGSVRAGRRPPRLSRSFALPKSCIIAGGRGSVRAGNGHRGSAGASPSQNRASSREGEAPSEPATATAAQQELRPPKIVHHPGRARLRPSRHRMPPAHQELRPPKIVQRHSGNAFELRE